MKIFKQNELSLRVILERVQSGQLVKHVTEKQRRLNGNINTLKDRYRNEEIELEEFLKRLAHSCNFKTNNNLI